MGTDSKTIASNKGGRAVRSGKPIAEGRVMRRKLAVAIGACLVALAVATAHGVDRERGESQGFHPLHLIPRVEMDPEEPDLEPFIDDPGPSPKEAEPITEDSGDLAEALPPGIFRCGWFIDAMAACDAAEAAADARRTLEVGIRLEGVPEPGEETLAEEAQRQFLAAKPMNPGRWASFPKWETTRPPDGEAARLIRTGWFMQIREIRTIPRGWQARVFVYPRARTEDRRFARIHDFHIEVYSFKDGKLALESEALDPDRPDLPVDGLRCDIRE